MATIEGRVSRIDQAWADGTTPTIRLDVTGAVFVSDAHARYQDAVRRGNVFIATNTAAQATSVNSTTATGLILTNPAGSGKNLVILELCVAIASRPAGASPLILTGSFSNSGAAVTHSSALTVRNAYAGYGNTGVGLADAAATIPAANIVRAIGGGAAATVVDNSSFTPFIRDEIAGLIILGQNTCVSLQSLTTAISVVASIMWEEIPL